MSVPDKTPGFTIDLNDTDDEPPINPLASMAASLGKGPPRPSPDELADVERRGEKLGFSRREPTPVGGGVASPQTPVEPAPVVIAVPEKQFIGIRATADGKQRWSDLVYEKRGLSAAEVLVMVLDAYEWAKENGWEG